MSENVVINGTTYNGVEALSLVRTDGTVVKFYTVQQAIATLPVYNGEVV